MQHIFIDHPLVFVAKPGCRSAPENPSCGRDRICFGNTPFMLSRRMYFVVLPRSFIRSGRLHVNSTKLVIQERHAALDRRRHAHLVLLHQQFMQIGLDVGVEQPIEQRRRHRCSASTCAHARIRIDRSPMRPRVSRRQQRCCIARGKTAKLSK